MAYYLSFLFTPEYVGESTNTRSNNGEICQDCTYVDIFGLFHRQ